METYKYLNVFTFQIEHDLDVHCFIAGILLIDLSCMMFGRIRDDIEKEDAFRGLCAMVRSYSNSKFLYVDCSSNWCFPLVFRSKLILLEL